jgi:hypothetical protein
MVQNYSYPSQYGVYKKDHDPRMDCTCGLSWIRSACRSRGVIAWKLELAHRVLWPLWDFFWDIYLSCRASKPISMVGLEGSIKVVAFFRKFPEEFCVGLVSISKEY